MQVKKLRLLLRARDLAAVRVGTVDDFQGQEARIIFISTVLSRPSTNSGALGTRAAAREAGLGPQTAAADPAVGFFRNPNRFNVAITRAQALMVVLGHPLVLMQVQSCQQQLRYLHAMLRQSSHLSAVQLKREAFRDQLMQQLAYPCGVGHCDTVLMSCMHELTAFT